MSLQKRLTLTGRELLFTLVERLQKDDMKNIEPKLVVPVVLLLASGNSCEHF